MADADLEQPLNSLSAGTTEENDDGSRVKFLRRRPMHQGRFLEFLRIHFGVMDEEPKEFTRDDSELRDSGETPQRSFGFSCKRRSRPPPPSEVPDTLQKTDVVASVNTSAASNCFAGCTVTAGAGCIWIAGHDDSKYEWTLVGEDSHRQHKLCTGLPWDTDATREAGERRIQLEFTLQAPSGVHANEKEVATSRHEVLEAGTADLRSKLLACLLTRDEAEDLDKQKPQEHPDHRAIRRLTGVLTFATSFVSALPGSGSLATLGEAGTRRVANILGSLDGPGHVDDLASDQCSPCEHEEEQSLISAG